jgi:putative RNA 2'-phosphotransferase
MLNRTVQLSKLMSLMLRHRPSEFGLVLDGHGFADLDAAVSALRSRDPDIGRSDIESVVYDGAKPRFEIVDNRIRARYGHSFPIDLGQDPVVPPEFLYKGIPPESEGLVLSEGLTPGDRSYVHLSFDADVAEDLGRGSCTVIRVDAEKAHGAGVPFYDCGPTILTPMVPGEFLSVERRGDSGPPDDVSKRLPRAARPSQAPSAESSPVSPKFGRRRRFVR